MQEDFQTILLVDSDQVERTALQNKFSRAGYRVVSLEKAEDALYLLKNQEVRPDLLISDVLLPKMDGVELLRRVKALDDPLPVLLITGRGNVEDAINALRCGADDFIRKPFNHNDIISSVRSILNRKKEEILAGSFAKFLEYEKSSYVIPNDISLINIVSFQLTRNLVPSGLCSKTTAENISLALKEAVSNAMFHGNLEVSSDIRELEGLKGFNEEIEKRISDPVYKDRKVKIQTEQTPDYVEYSIEDEGKGFNVKSLPDPRDPEYFLRNSGRGLLIIGVHMDSVRWNEKGNCIILRKNKTCRQEN